MMHSLMDRGPWECIDFQECCVHGREKISKLFKLHEFNAHRHEKIRPYVIRLMAPVMAFHVFFFCKLLVSLHGDCMIHNNSKQLIALAQLNRAISWTIETDVLS